MKFRIAGICLRAICLLAIALTASVTFASNHNLQHNRWSLLTIPANSSSQSLAQLFSDDLSSTTYDQEWVVFRFDPQLRNYVKATPESTLSQGDGFWMLQRTGVDVLIDLPSGLPDGDAEVTSVCATANGCFRAELFTSAATTSWSTLGAPYSAPVDISKIRISNTSGACSVGCDFEQAKSANLSDAQWTYNSASEEYEKLTDSSFLSPWQGFWVQSAAMSADSNLSLLFPSPNTANTNVQGLHTSLSELMAIRQRAQNGDQLYEENIDRVVAIATEGWPYGDVSTTFGGTTGADVYDKQCLKLSDPQMSGIVRNAGSQIFSMVLSYILTDSVSYAADARSILLDFAGSSGFDTVEGRKTYTGANQCAFDISRLTPLLIESAQLLEAYPGWTAADKSRFQSWLASEIYPVTSAIARTRKNNWGTAAAFSSWAIGHYLTGSAIRLNEVYPAANSFSPDEARREHIQTQLDIVGTQWPGDTRCEIYGFQVHGGYPDELRRGNTGCGGTYLYTNDRSYSYQITTMNHLIYHAEALRRHGNNELYSYELSNGNPLILQGITFVIDNANGTSYDWNGENLGVLRIANDFLNDDRLCRQLVKGTFFREGIKPNLRFQQIMLYCFM